jgi:hypothetical protein
LTFGQFTLCRERDIRTTDIRTTDIWTIYIRERDIRTTDIRTTDIWTSDSRARTLPVSMRDLSFFPFLGFFPAVQLGRLA